MSVLDSVALPAGWSRVRLGSISTRRQTTGSPDSPLLSVFLGDGVIPRDQRPDNHNQVGADLGKYQRVLPGDIVFNKLRTWQGGFGVSKYDGIISPAYIIVAPDGSVIDSRFLHHLLHSDPYLAELTRLSKWMPPSQFDIAWEDIRSVDLLVPPLDEQRRIADFLDDQTTRIDQIIAARKRQKDWLAELEEGTIEKIVWDSSTGGVQLRRLGTGVTTGPFGTVFAAADYVAGGVPMINPTHIVDGQIVPDLNHSVSPETASRLQRHRLSQGDLVTGRKGDLGRSAMVGAEEEGWICGSDAIAIHPDPRYLEPHFLDLVLHLPRARSELVSQSPGATMPSLNESMLLSVEVPAVDVEEQRRRTIEGRSAREAFKSARTVLDRSIELLQEFKRSLISAAVAGELDVSSAGGRGVPA